MRQVPVVAFILILLSATTGRCQDPAAIKIRGIVRNSATGEPIAYATIRLTGKAIATMTNEQGRFIFKMAAIGKDDSLHVTHIGFTPLFLPVRTIDTGTWNIALNESPSQLTAVEVKPPNPFELIRRAIEKIPENYPDSPFRLTGFYRLDGTKDSKVVDLSEAVFHIYIDGYQGKNSEFHLVKSRVDKDLTAFNGSDQVSMGYKPNGIMSFDFERRLDNWELFQKDAAKEFVFKYKGKVDYNGKEVFLITFEEKPGIKKSLIDGRLYLDASDLAFLELDAKRNRQGLKYYDEWTRLQHLMFDMFHFSVRLLSDTMSITYQFNGSALVQYEGSVIYEKGFGVADPSVNRPNTTATQFRIGSTSKQFTALLIMQMVNEGKLSVDDSAGKFLPGFRNGRVTIRQLLTHQSGIPNYTDNEEALENIMVRRYTPDELVYRFCSDSLEFEPGSRFNYTNSGFVVLADIIEKVTGKKYAQVLAERIFIPLSMNSSFFVSGDTTNLAKAYSGGRPEKPYLVQNVVGAGGITSTAGDLLRWANALSANTLLPKEMMEELFKPRVAWDEWNAWYGYGWMIDRHLFDASKRHLVQYHPGIEFGFHDILLREPDKNVVVILLSNMGDFPRFDMTDLILNELN